MRSTRSCKRSDERLHSLSLASPRAFTKMHFLTRVDVALPTVQLGPACQTAFAKPVTTEPVTAPLLSPHARNWLRRVPRAKCPHFFNYLSHPIKHSDSADLARSALTSYCSANIRRPQSGRSICIRKGKPKQQDRLSSPISAIKEGR